MFILNAYPYSGNWLRSAGPPKGDYPCLEMIMPVPIHSAFPQKGDYPNPCILTKLAAFGRSPKGGFPVFGDDNAYTYTLGFSPKGGLPESVHTLNEYPCSVIRLHLE